MVWEKVYHLTGQKDKWLFSVLPFANVSDSGGEFNYRKSKSFRVLSLTSYVTTGNVIQMSLSLRFLF